MYVPLEFILVEALTHSVKNLVLMIHDLHVVLPHEKFMTIE